jgi:hypothetical protein
MADCIFCAIVAGELPAQILAEDEHTVSFLDINPWTRGHSLVVPRKHSKDLLEIDPNLPTILVSHFPLTREPTRILRYPVFAQWCGTEQTADWHRRFRARTVVYGHLHIPRTMFQDGVRFEEVSLGYPYEQDRHPERPRQLIQILPPGPARTLGPPRSLR